MDYYFENKTNCGADPLVYSMLKNRGLRRTAFKNNTKRSRLLLRLAIAITALLPDMPEEYRMKYGDRYSIYLVAGASILFACAAGGQVADAPDGTVAGIPANYTEARVGDYTLPDPLQLLNGQTVKDARTWFNKRRPEIVKLFEENQYGRSPGRPKGMDFEVFDKGTPAFDGKAIRRQVTVYFSKDKAGPKMDLLIYLPAGAAEPVPLLLNAGLHRKLPDCR